MACSPLAACLDSSTCQASARTLPKATSLPAMLDHMERSQRLSDNRRGHWRTFTFTYIPVSTGQPQVFEAVFLPHLPRREPFGGLAGAVGGRGLRRATEPSRDPGRFRLQTLDHCRRDAFQALRITFNGCTVASRTGRHTRCCIFLSGRAKGLHPLESCARPGRRLCVRSMHRRRMPRHRRARGG